MITRPHTERGRSSAASLPSAPTAISITRWLTAACRSREQPEATFPDGTFRSTVLKLNGVHRATDSASIAAGLEIAQGLLEKLRANHAIHPLKLRISAAFEAELDCNLTPMFSILFSKQTKATCASGTKHALTCTYPARSERLELPTV